LHPICHVSLGRSGSTHIMSLLSRCPSIVTHERHPYETFIANHIVKLYKVLSLPSDHTVYPKYKPLKKLIGPFPDYKFNERNPYFDEAIEITLESIFKPFCREAITTIYSQLAQFYKKKNVTHFAEKVGFFLIDDLNNIFDKVFSVVSVRDFRDLLSSIKLFNQKRGYKAFGAEQFDTFEEYAQNLFSVNVRSFCSWIKQHKNCLIIRYEDFINDPKNSITKILNYAEVQFNETDLEAIFATLNDQNEHHKTSVSSELSINKFEDILSKREKEICDSLLKDELQMFDYI